MKRRTAIVTVLGTLAMSLPLAHWLTRRPFTSKIMEATAHPVLLSLIARKEDIRQIGEGFNATVQNAKELSSTILQDIPLKVFQPDLQESLLKLEISKKIQREFEKGEIEIVKGWVLSKTEVVQCQLYCLLLSKNS